MDVYDVLIYYRNAKASATNNVFISLYAVEDKSHVTNLHNVFLDTEEDKLISGKLRWTISYITFKR